MTSRTRYGVGLAVGMVLVFGVAAAQETVQTTDGREILLHADGTYEIVDAGPHGSTDHGDGYRPVSLTDLKLDIDRMTGQRVEVTVSIHSTGGMVTLGDPERTPDMNPVMADSERLPRRDRALILERCGASGCRATVQGEVTPHWTGGNSLELHRIVRD